MVKSNKHEGVISIITITIKNRYLFSKIEILNELFLLVILSAVLEFSITISITIWNF